MNTHINFENITIPKTIEKKEIVSVMAYMIGISEEHWMGYFSPEYDEKLTQLKDSKEASIIRYLCQFRTALMLNFKKVDADLKYNMKNPKDMMYFDRESLNKLEKWGVDIIQPNYLASDYCRRSHLLIEKHISDCESLFPEWVNFKYIKSLFFCSKYNDEKVLKAEFTTYQAHKLEYPFGQYICWEPVSKGNILMNDKKFLEILYAQHNEVFNDTSKTRDASDDTKNNIYHFLETGERIELVVDCENSDPYKIYGMIKNLNANQLEKVEKMVLYDDPHTSCAWDWLEKYISIPVKHEEVNRVADNKSLVDIKMTAGVTKDFYKENIDSFVLLSSDSDFWGLISSLPEAHFLVMYEYDKCGHAIKTKLEEYSIYNCAIDDFYTGNAQELKKKVLLEQLKAFSCDFIGKNAWELTKEVYKNAKIQASEQEMKQFYEKHVKTIRLKIDAEGNFNFAFEE